MTSSPIWPAVAVIACAGAFSGVRRWLAAERVARRLAPSDAPQRVEARRVPAIARMALAAAGLPAEHHATLVRCWVGAVAAGLGSVLVMPAGPVVAGVAAIGPPVAVLLCSGRAARLRSRSVPLALDAVVAAMRAGHSLGSAVAETKDAGPAGAELAEVARAAGAGLPLVEAIGHWAGDHPDVGTRLAAASLAVAADVGGPGADAIEAAAASLRERAAIDDEIAALSVQARASAALLAVTPIGFTFLLTTLDPASARFLLGSQVGWLCLAVGLGLDAAGALWMHRLVKAAR